MIRVYLLIIVLVVIFYLMRWFMKTPSTQIASYFRKTGLIALIGLLTVLAVLGKLNWLFALIGVMIASFVRFLPYFLRYLPQLQGLWKLFKHSRKAKTENAEQNVNLGSMSKSQAYQILGLKPGASRQEIIQAHRKLMQKNHPDRGGSDFLATQINRAKKTLLDQ